MSKQSSPVSQDLSAQRDAIVAVISENRGWFIAIGVLLVVVGLAAILMPFASSIAVEFIAGVSLAVAGIGQIIQGFKTKDWGGFFLAVIVGVLWLFAGVLLIARPFEGLAFLTLLVAMAFIADGIVRAILAFQLRPEAGWGWMLLGGIVGILVGAMLWSQFPITAIWALGVLAGVNILFSGVGTLMIAALNPDTTSGAKPTPVSGAKAA